MTGWALFSKIVSDLAESAATALKERQNDSLILFGRAWAERRLTPELIMFRCTWL